MQQCREFAPYPCHCARKRDRGPFSTGLLPCTNPQPASDGEFGAGAVCVGSRMRARMDGDEGSGRHTASEGLGRKGRAVIGLDVPVLLFAGAITLLTTLLCGLVPALRASKRDLQPQLVGCPYR
jgi:hypothetical protein